MLVIASTRSACKMTHVNVMVASGLRRIHSFVEATGPRVNDCGSQWHVFRRKPQKLVVKGDFLTNSLACLDSLGLSQGEKVFELIY